MSDVINLIESILLNELKKYPDTNMIARKIYKEVFEPEMTQSYSEGWDDGYFEGRYEGEERYR